MPIEMNLRLHTAFISKGKKLSVQFIKKRTHNKEFEITLIKVCVCPKVVVLQNVKVYPPQKMRKQRAMEETATCPVTAASHWKIWD